MWELRLKLRTTSVVVTKTAAHKSKITKILAVALAMAVVPVTVVAPVTVALVGVVPPDVRAPRCLLLRPVLIPAKEPSKALGVTKVAVR